MRGQWRIAVAVLAAGLAGTMAQAEDAAFRFVWEGANGYEMRGAMSFDAALLGQEQVRARDLTCFEMQGRRDGAPVGRWALGMLDEETTWRLTFLPQSTSFAVFGPGHLMPQAWNMDGAGTDCGEGGFGFNIGNAAQDLCLNNRLVVASQVDPFRPFPAVRDDKAELPGDACYAPPLLGELSMDRSQG